LHLPGVIFKKYLPQDDNKYFGTSLTLQEGRKVDGNFLEGREGAGI